MSKHTPRTDAIASEMEHLGSGGRALYQGRLWSLAYALEAELTAARAERDALRAALKGLLARDQRTTCQHERTHRGGAIWEICDGCGLKWADDEGGKPEWVDPPEWDAARAAITKATGGNDE